MAKDTSDHRNAAPLIRQEHFDSPEERELNNRWNLREDEVPNRKNLGTWRLLINGHLSRHSGFNFGAGIHKLILA